MIHWQQILWGYRPLRWDLHLFCVLCIVLPIETQQSLNERSNRVNDKARMLQLTAVRKAQHLTAVIVVGATRIFWEWSCSPQNKFWSEKLDVLKLRYGRYIWFFSCSFASFVKHLTMVLNCSMSTESWQEVFRHLHLLFQQVMGQHVCQCIRYFCGAYCYIGFWTGSIAIMVLYHRHKHHRSYPLS